MTKVHIFLTLELTDYLDPVKRAPSFSVDLPHTFQSGVTTGPEFRAQVENEVTWLKKTWCCFWQMCPDKSVWMPWACNTPLYYEAGKVPCVRATLYAPKAGSISLVYVGQEIDYGSAPIANVPLQQQLSLEKQLHEAIPDLRNYNCGLYGRLAGSGGLILLDQSLFWVLPKMTYVLAVPKEPQGLPQAPKQRPPKDEKRAGLLEGMHKIWLGTWEKVSFSAAVDAY